MPKSFAVVSLLLLVTLGRPTSGRMREPNGELPARVATHHTMGLNERRLDYEAVAETLPVTDAKGNTTASIFTVSYLTDGENGSARPVSFVFNGGPGAASVFLHLGALGPQILQTPENGAVPTPPVHLIDNPATWLGFTDLVFVDPVGTGFSRGKGKEENPDKPFWDVRADIASLGLGDPAVADPASALDIAGLAGRGELWRLPGGGDGANLAARCRRDREGARPGLAGARPLGPASDRTRSSRRRLHSALLRRHRGRLRRSRSRRHSGGRTLRPLRLSRGSGRSEGTAFRRRSVDCPRRPDRRGFGGYRAPLPRSDPAPHLRPRDPS